MLMMMMMMMMYNHDHDVSSYCFMIIIIHPWILLFLIMTILILIILTIILIYSIVFTLRLSPVIPIPVAAYNYVYSITSVTTLDFLLGITLGSIKPYLLDCYLGLFGKSILDNPPSDNNDGFISSSGDYVLLGIVTLVIIVGTFAGQIVTNTWKEIQSEIKLIASSSSNDENEIDSSTSSRSGNEMGFFELLGITDSDLPTPVQVREAGRKYVTYYLLTVLDGVVVCL
jgi:hypothetical protein